MNDGSNCANTNEKRWYNEIHPIACISGHTAAEYDANAEARFVEAWRNELEGQARREIQACR
jgi:hypothetical protein